MRLTASILEKGKSKRGGWSRIQVEKLGVSWPLAKGWKKSVIGKDFPDEQLASFLDLTNSHTKSRMTIAPEEREKRLLLAAKRKSYRRKTSFVAKDTWSTKNRERLLAKENDAEQHVDNLLASLPLTFRRERPINIEGKKYFIDFLVTSMKRPDRKKVRIAIEVDGGYHLTDEQKQRDARKDLDLMSTSRVWSVVRISDKTALAMTPDTMLQAITSAKIGCVQHL